MLILAFRPHMAMGQQVKSITKADSVIRMADSVRLAGAAKIPLAPLCALFGWRA